MPATLIRNHASTGDFNPQVIPLTGKTVGRDVFVLFSINATPTLPSPWIQEFTDLDTNGYIKLWRLPAASNTAGVTQLSIALNGGRALTAVVWEDDLDTGTTIYCARNGGNPTGATPALQGTGLHTFVEHEQTFAFFINRLANAASTYDLVSYDQGYSEFADSGIALGTEPRRTWMAGLAPGSMTSNGVTATANETNATVIAGFGGMIAYDVGEPPGAPAPSGGDDTAALQAYIDGLADGTVGAPTVITLAADATYRIDTQLAFTSREYLTLDLNGATLDWNTADNDARRLLKFTTCTGIHIKNGSLVGTYTYPASGDAHVTALQHMHAVHAEGSDVTVESDVTISSFYGDGVYYGNSGVTQSTGACHAAISQIGRNGVSVVGGDSITIGGSIERCGFARIDLEPNPDTDNQSATNITIDGVAFGGQGGTTYNWGIVLLPWSGGTNSVIEDVTIRNCTATDEDFYVRIGNSDDSDITRPQRIAIRDNHRIDVAGQQSYMVEAYHVDTIDITGNNPESAVSFYIAYLEDCTDVFVADSVFTGTGNTMRGEAPVNTVAPAVTGTPTVGQTLSCSQGTWTGDPTITYAYQWQRNTIDISGEITNTYVAQAGDEGDSIRCVVTASNTEGSASANSNAVTITAAASKLTIAEENALDANITAPEMEISGAGDLTSLGFCREFSLNVGETATFAVDGDAVEIDIVRVGWYGGVGYRLVDTIVNTPVEQGDPVTISNSNGSITCEAWTDTAQWEIPSNATPGYYIGVVRSVPGPNASFIPFIVRDDDRPADIMVKSSDTTWALAYNYYGTPADPEVGKSLYGSTGPMSGGITNRGHAATYHRPIITREGIPQTYPFYTEFPLVRYLERMGFNVTYSASKDWREGIDAPTLASCKVYIAHGHDEYWSQGMRDKWVALREAGKHLLFMCGNEVFWRTRFDAGGDVMWCFKDTMDGPGVHNAGDVLDPVTWTGTWKDTRAGNNATRAPEWMLTGTDFRMNGINYRAMVIPAESPESQTPFWRHTDVEAEGLTVADVIGMEADELRPLQPGTSYSVLAQTTVNIDNNRADDNGEDYTLDGDLNWGIVAQRYSSGALVVGFGTVTWAWGLDNNHDVTGAASDTLANSQQQQAMLNLLRDLGVAVPATPISGLTAPTPVSLDDYGVVTGIRHARYHVLKDGIWQNIDFTPEV